jgi:hypothetical protein
MKNQASNRHEIWVSTVSAVKYAMEIVGAEQVLPLLPERVITARAAKYLATIRSDETLSDLCALVVERALADFAPDSAALCRWRSAAGLVDVGARPLLSERAADAIEQISITSVIGE